MAKQNQHRHKTKPIPIYFRNVRSVSNSEMLEKFKKRSVVETNGKGRKITNQNKSDTLRVATISYLHQPNEQQGQIEDNS